MFKPSRRHRFFKVWLIAIACQTGQLFSQVENTYGQSDYSGQPHQYSWYSPDNIPDSRGMGNDSAFDYPSNYYYSESPRGISSEQVQTIIDPDNHSWYASPQSYYEASDYSQSTSQNEWQTSADLNQSYDSPYEEQDQSSNSWQASSPYYWSEVNDQSALSNWEEQNVSQEPTTFTDGQITENHSSDFASFPPPIRPGFDKQNFTSFDPDLEEAPDKEQHPLSDEGKATAYHFENDHSVEKKSVTASIANRILKQELISSKVEEKPPANLAEGKGNIKVIQKRSEPIPPARRLEEALRQPEEVIGKTAVSEPVIGMTNDQKNRESFPNNTNYRLKTENQPTQSTQTPSMSLDYDDITLSDDEQIAQLRNASAPQPTTTLVPPRTPTIVTPTTASPDTSTSAQSGAKSLKEVSINFNNVAMIEYIRFISRISNKNFIFDDEDLQFNVTIVSEEPTTIDNLMAALLQELRIRNLSLIEQGNNLIIHRNPRVRSPARIVADGNELINAQDSELVTRVFRLNTLDPLKASEIIRPLLSDDALIEVLRDSNNLIITDLVTNVNKITQLIGTLDAPNSGVTIGQYVVRNAFVDSLVDLANRILQPIAQGNPFVLVPHPVSNSIFIVSNSFIVEKALAILQNLDLNEGRTKILSLETLQPTYPSYTPSTAPGTLPGKTETFPRGNVGTIPGIGGNQNGPGGLGGPIGVPGGVSSGNRLGTGGIGEWIPGRGDYDPDGQLINPEAVPESFPFENFPADGRFVSPNASNIPGFPPSIFNPGGIGSEGRPSAIFDESRSFLPGGIGAASRWAHELPVGHIERTLFFIYKLRYRKGDSIEIALRKIANSLQLMGTANADLISAINSSQWIESSNALIFTGTTAALEKVRELILEVDVPLRQVFIEMLILDTTITDSLSYSVDWINRLGGGTTTGEQGFFSTAPSASTPSLNNFLSSSEKILNSGSVIPPSPAEPLPVAQGFLNSGGFAAGIIGTHLTHHGTRFSTIGALVRAIHTDQKADIILNPKIITEDNNPAEIFVGGTDRYKTQSITNDLGSLVTNNFQFIDVGTTLRVTPLIGNNGIITLEIVQETTSQDPQANNPAFDNNQSVNLVPVLTKTRTVTKVHVPNGFFVILSGMIQDNQSRAYSRIPCLGGIPILGCIGKSQNNADNKRNLMLFIRPMIIETNEDYEDITRRQQDVYREKCKFRRSWNYEIDEALNFGNIKYTDPDDMNCGCSDRQQR